MSTTSILVALPEQPLFLPYGPEGKKGQTANALKVREETSCSQVLNVLMSCCWSRTPVLLALPDTCAVTLPCASALVYTAPKPRGPVLENTKHAEVATPTVKRGFVSSKFWGQVRLHLPHMVSGGMGLPARMAARLRACFQHPVHLLCLKTQTVASLIHAGTKTMTATQLASRRAAPTQPNAGTLDPIQLHADARNALSMAVFYLNQPQANIAGARRKAIQALSALRGLDLSLEA